MKKELDIKGKWALITGASSGIGKAYAERFAAEKANLVLVARNQDTLEKIAKELRAKHGVETLAISKDLSRLSSPEELFKEVERNSIHIDILVNNAGFAVYGNLHTTDVHRNQEQLMLNIVALSTLTQLFIKPMAENRSGVIINVASTAAFQPLPYMSNYGASKSFVLQFSEALWAEYQDLGVRVLAVCPGATETNFFNVVGAKEASVGKRDTPENVVNESLQALNHRKSYIIPGSMNNYLLSLMGRFLSRRLIAKFSERVMRPKPE